MKENRRRAQTPEIKNTIYRRRDLGMNRYEKGANFERKLVSDLWAHGWAAMRAAGSGTTSYPVPDVIAAKTGKPY